MQYMQQRVRDNLISNSAYCRARNISTAGIDLADLIFEDGKCPRENLFGFLCNFCLACFTVSLQQPEAAATGLPANSFALNLKVPTVRHPKNWRSLRKPNMNFRSLLQVLLVVAVALRNAEGNSGCDSALVKAVDCKER